MKKQIVMSVMTKDRPGIIASVTKTIFDAGGDIADLNQTIVCGYLTMLLGVSFDSQREMDKLKQELNKLALANDFAIAIKELGENEKLQSLQPSGELYVLTLQGPNRSGIVHSISTICGRCKVNILALSTSLENGRFTMALQLDVSETICSLEELRKEFQSYADSTEHTMSMQHNDIFQGTNEVTLH